MGTKGSDPVDQKSLRNSAPRALRTKGSDPVDQNSLRNSAPRALRTP